LAVVPLFVVLREAFRLKLELGPVGSEMLMNSPF